MLKYTDNTCVIAYETRGNPEGQAVLWAHGWGQSHGAFLPLAQSFGSSGFHTLVDFPGFGLSPLPDGPWGTEEYADALARFLKSTIKKPVVLVGHSFGCRVGLRLAAKYPDLVAGLFLIAAAGLKPKRSVFKTVYLATRIFIFKALKKLVPFGLSQEKLYTMFGSADYRNAGGLRPIFVKVVNEDLSDTARAVKCPVVLVYGARDTETPIDIGQRFHAFIKNSELIALENLDHYSVLGEGRHQVAPLLKRFLEKCGNGHV